MPGNITDAREIASLDTWLAGEADVHLEKVIPDLIRKEGDHITFRWFEVVIAGGKYLVGVNIHFGGDLGGMWIKNNKSDRTREYHPNAAPQHNLTANVRSKIKDHTLRSKDQAVRDYFKLI